MKALKYIVFALTSFFTLLSCTPSFETTASMCETYLPLNLLVENYVVKTSEGYEEDGGEIESEYKLYLEDVVNSMKDMQEKDYSEGVISPEAQQALDFFFAKAREHMGYEVTDGKIDFADNPLDYLEFLLNAIDGDEKIGSFEQAREQMARGIEQDDGFCNYRNSQISVFREDENNDSFDSLEAILDMSYHPSNDVVNTTFLISFKGQELSAADIVETLPISGLNTTLPEDFKEVGMGDAYLRQASFQSADSTERFVIDISENFKSDEVEDLIVNTFCTNGDGDNIVCADQSNIREVQHDDCSSGDDDETGMVQINTFDIIEDDADFGDLHRFKVEVDYANEEVHFYISQFNQAILKPGFTLEQAYDEEDKIISSTVIFNPTNCEQQAILDELFDDLPEDEQDADSDGVSLTRVPDRGFDDYFLDSGGSIVDEGSDEAADLDPSTTPIFTFTGTAIPSRQ